MYLKAHTAKRKYMYAHTHVHIRSEVMDTLTQNALKRSFLNGKAGVIKTTGLEKVLYIITTKLGLS